MIWNDNFSDFSACFLKRFRQWPMRMHRRRQERDETKWESALEMADDATIVHDKYNVELDDFLKLRSKPRSVPRISDPLPKDVQAASSQYVQGRSWLRLQHHGSPREGYHPPNAELQRVWERLLPKPRWWEQKPSINYDRFQVKEANVEQENLNETLAWTKHNQISLEIWRRMRISWTCHTQMVFQMESHGRRCTTASTWPNPWQSRLDQTTLRNMVMTRPATTPAALEKTSWLASNFYSQKSFIKIYRNAKIFLQTS